MTLKTHTRSASKWTLLAIIQTDLYDTLPLDTCGYFTAGQVCPIRSRRETKWRNRHALLSWSYGPHPMSLPSQPLPNGPMGQGLVRCVVSTPRSWRDQSDSSVIYYAKWQLAATLNFTVDCRYVVSASYMRCSMVSFSDCVNSDPSLGGVWTTQYGRAETSNTFVCWRGKTCSSLCLLATRSRPRIALRKHCARVRPHLHTLRNNLHSSAGSRD